MGTGAERIQVLVADDEEPARQRLIDLLAKDAQVAGVAEAADGEAAVEEIQRRRPDLVFLDVQMPELDGLAVIDAIGAAEMPLTVFVTAYDQHAIRAFEVCAIDYLLKPFSNARFSAALGRAKEEIRKARTSTLSQQVERLLEHVRELDAPPGAAPPGPAAGAGPDYADRIVLKADGALHFIKTRDVIWIEAQGDFVKVQTQGKTQLVRETLQSMERKLDAAKFLRTHRSFLVNLEHVRKVEVALYGDYVVFMSDGSKLRLSRNYRSKLKALLKQIPTA